MNSPRPITAQDFDHWSPALRVVDHDHPRRFAALTIEGGVEVALAWRSDGIEPVVMVDSTTSAVWIGVDQRVVCVTSQGSILFSVGLGSSLLDIKRLGTFVAVLCDAEVLTVNQDKSIRGIHHLGDVPSDIDLIDDQLIVTLLDGSTETLA